MKMPAITPAQRATISQIQCTISCLTNCWLVHASYQQKVGAATKKKAPVLPRGLSVGRQLGRPRVLCTGWWWLPLSHSRGCGH